MPRTLCPLRPLLRLFLLPGLLLLAFSGHCHADRQTVLVLGDSISAAYGMSLEQGWVAQLASDLEQQTPPYSVVNASISGETTAGGLRRLPALLQAHQPELVIIELGGNDGLRGYPLDMFESNLKDLVERSREAGAKVILVPMEIPPNYGSRYTQGFRQVFQSVADNTDAVLAPFILQGIATDPQLMQEDGIHPTVDAQPKLLENLRPTVMAVLATS